MQISMCTSSYEVKDDWQGLVKMLSEAMVLLE